MSRASYESADEATLSEILRLAESRLAAQLDTAIAADQRALTFASLLVAAVAALVGFVATRSEAYPSLSLVALFLSLSAGLAFWSARPTPWSFVGTEPSLWLADLSNPNMTLHQSRAEMAEHYDHAILKNDRRFDAAADAILASWLLTSVALVFLAGWALLAI